MTVEDRDFGYRGFVRTFGRLGQPAVDVGIHPEDGAREVDGITVAGYATVNEFGSADGHTPERSFMRATFDEHDGYATEMTDAIGKMIDEIVITRGGGRGARVLDRELGKLGAVAAGDIRTKIRDLRDPPNAPSTLARKFPGDNPLIDSGRMRQAISFRVVED